LPNVRLVAPVPRHAVFEWFSTASLSLVSFVDVPSVAASSPSKLFDAMATACPVLVTNPGWTRQLVEENGCGWYTPAGDPDRMASALKDILDDHDMLERAGENAVRVARVRFDRNSLADTFENILLETVSRHSARLQPS
jgi:glycosyltransferase involved in cell wall biosynthesis